MKSQVVRWLLLVRAAWCGAAVALADDEATLLEVEQFLVRFDKFVSSANREALPGAIQRAAKLHDSIENRSRRAQLRAALSDVIGNRRVNSAHAAAVRALLSINDPGAGFRRLRKYLPKKRNEPLSDQGLLVLRGIKDHPVDVAISSLKKLARSDTAAARSAAIAALGGYGKSAKRESILKFLLGSLDKLKVEKSAPLNGPWLKEWLRTVPALVAALQQLTGRDPNEAGVWIAAYKQHRRALGVLFDPAQPMPAYAAPPEGAWKEARVALGRPDKEVAAAVQRALSWLARHQNADGSFRAAEFVHRCRSSGKCNAPGHARCDLGVSALAVQAFLVAGYSGGGKHAHDETVRKGLAWIATKQDERGRFSSHDKVGWKHTMGYRARPGMRGLDGKWIMKPWPSTLRDTEGGYAGPYAHAIATLAFVEAYGLTGSEGQRERAQRGLDYIAASRNPNLAWRYWPGSGENDTSVTAWQTQALCVARMINAAALRAGGSACLRVDEAALDGARDWIEKMTDPEFGQVGYNVAGGSPVRPQGLQDKFPAEKSASMTAVGILTRIFLGEDPKTSPMVKAGAKIFTGPNLLPDWNPENGSIDMYYWHFATLALLQVGGKEWKSWSPHLRAALLANQRAGDGCDSGSWDPIGPWGRDGGRVYSTALNALTILTPWRFQGWGN